MRGKLTKSAQIAPRQMQTIMVCTISQSKEACLCLMAYLRVFVKPKLRTSGSRKRNLQGSLLAVALSSFRASMELRITAVKEHVRTRLTPHEKSLYWLHATDPRAI